MLIDEIQQKLLFPSKETFLSMLSKNKSNFRIIILNKGTEKERVVFAPKKVTKTCQQYILDNYLFKMIPSKYVVSYQKGKSIIDVVKPHVRNRYFLHLDIKHFFNKMKWEMFKKILAKHFSDSDFYKLLLNEQNEKFLNNILCYKNRIVQGSVTSPCISNLYLFEFDNYVDELIKKIPNGSYTRYSDDIYISSSSYIAHSIIDQIKDKLNEYGLKLNYSKISYKKMKNSVKITGLSLTKSRDIVLSTKFKKNLKKEIYQTIKNEGKNVNFNHLFGSLFYLRFIDPRYFNFLQNKYGLNDLLLVSTLIELKKNADNSQYN